jgi:hypothetical protein
LAILIIRCCWAFACSAEIIVTAIVIRIKYKPRKILVISTGLFPESCEPIRLISIAFILISFIKTLQMYPGLRQAGNDYHQNLRISNISEEKNNR